MGIVRLLAVAASLAALSISARADGAAAQTQSLPAVQRDFGVSPFERRAAEQGKLTSFWRSRSRAGDPVACIALASLDPSRSPALCRFNGWVATARLVWFLPSHVSDGESLRAIQIALMQAHVRAIDADRDGVPGLLSPQQIAAYHHDVFVAHGVPHSAFGGTPFAGHIWETGLTSIAWCGGCDRLRDGAR